MLEAEAAVTVDGRNEETEEALKRIYEKMEEVMRELELEAALNNTPTPDSTSMPTPTPTEASKLEDDLENFIFAPVQKK